jgi:hypothetical protein
MDSNNIPEGTGRRGNMTRIGLCYGLQEPCKLEAQQVLPSALQWMVGLATEPMSGKQLEQP